MIIDYFFLLDHKETFKSKKYVVYVSREQQSRSLGDETNILLQDFKSNLY